MISMINQYICPYTIIHLERVPEDDSVYRVIKKVDLDIPSLFGQIPSESHFASEEYLMLGFDYNEFDERWEYSLLTTNPDALGRAEINPFFQGESPTRIARFTLSPHNMACISYDEYRIILEFSDDLRRLSLWAYNEEKEPEREINPEWGRNFKGPLYAYRTFLS